VQQHECGFVGKAKITAQGQRALALYLIAEYGDRGEVRLLRAICLQESAQV
jgi:hypothetical protein